jgi:prepilin-type processing-associated H-X9-DG protein
VELLVVVGIIALLISVLMPSLQRARLLAQRTQCLAQMDQLGKALMMYAAENKGRTPIQPQSAVVDFGNPAVYDTPNINGRNLFATLFPYYNENRRVLVCPVASDTTWTGGQVPNALSDTNYMVSAPIVNKPLAKIKRCSEIIAVQEDRFRWDTAWLRPAVNHAPPAKPVYVSWTWNNTGTWGPNGQQWGQEYTSVHQNGGNLLFCDGHSEWRKHQDIRAHDFGLTGGAGVGGNADDPSTTGHGQTYYAEFD